MAELFDEAADGIVASTSADFDFKILKELRSDYQGDENESENDNQAQNTQEQKDQKQLIKGIWFEKHCNQKNKFLKVTKKKFNKFFYI